MNDDVSSVDENPISLPRSFNTDAWTAVILDVLHKVIGHGTDVTLRPAARHDHVIAY